jgi:prepilin-type processing-associated H-X9-DG protein
LVRRPCEYEDEDSFPYHDGWAAFAGQRPATPDLSGDASDYGGDQWMNMLFGDGHVQYGRFPPNYDTNPLYQSGWFSMTAPWW